MVRREEDPLDPLWMELAAPELDLVFISEEQLLFDPQRHTLSHGNMEGTGRLSCSHGREHG